MDESIGKFDHQPCGVIIQLRVTHLLEEDTGHEPSNDREGGRDGTGEEVRVLLQELVVTEQTGEPFCRTRERTSDYGSIPNTQSWVKEANSMVSDKTRG
jgi:hypothetical protein